MLTKFYSAHEISQGDQHILILSLRIVFSEKMNVHTVALFWRKDKPLLNYEATEWQLSNSFFKN
jgi:hypothetical protein